MQRQAAANLWLDIAQYEDVKGFARFGTILDEATKQQIERDERLIPLLGPIRSVAEIAWRRAD